MTRMPGVNFFIANEVENTNMYGVQTLFVVGKQKVEKIIEWANAYHIQHIYLGANKSIDLIPFSYLHPMVSALIANNFHVTVDLPLNMMTLLRCPPHEKLTVIASVVVDEPAISKHDHLYIKFDDIEMASRNPGVWCVNAKSVLNDGYFTPWNQYDNDTVIEQVVVEEI